MVICYSGYSNGLTLHKFYKAIRYYYLYLNNIFIFKYIINQISHKKPVKIGFVIRANLNEKFSDFYFLLFFSCTIF
jgi:hypothetical protein